MRKALFLISLLAITGTPLVHSAVESTSWKDIFLSGHTGSLGLHVGGRFLDKDEWSPGENQLEMGIGLDLGKVDWPFLIHLGYLTASGDATSGKFPKNRQTLSAKTETSELRLGIKHLFNRSGNFRPWLSAGLSRVNFSGTLTTTEYYQTPDMNPPFYSVEYKEQQDHQATAFWMTGGAEWLFFDSLSLGMELGYTLAFAPVEYEPTDPDYGIREIPIGGSHAHLVIGYHW